MFLTLRYAAVLTAAVCITSCTTSPEQKQASHMRRGTQFLEQKDYSRAILEFRNAAQIPGKGAEVLFQLATAYLSAGDVAAGVRELRRATELDPKHTAAQARLASLLVTTENSEMLQDAERRSQALLDTGSADVEVLNTLTVAQWKLGKREDAEKHLREAFERFPGDVSSSVALARLHLAKKDVAGAESVLKRAVAQNASADSYVALGDFQAQTGKVEDAEKAFIEANRLDPKYAPALLDLAALQVRSGRAAEAEQTYKRLAGLPGTYKPIYAAFLLKTGKHEQSIAEFRRLLSEAPGDRDARTRLIAALLYVNRPAEAEKILAEALRKNPRDIDGLLHRARISLAGGKLDEAQNDLQRVLQMNSESSDAHFLLSAVFRGRNLTFNEKQELGEALQRNAAYLPARLRLASIHLGENNPKFAIDLLNSAPRQQSTDPQLVTYRNWGLLMMGQRVEAGKSIDQVLKASPNPEALVQHALVKLEDKDYSAARRSLEDALRQNPDNAGAVNLLAQTYRLQNQNSAGIQKIREYAAARPGSALLQNVLGQWLIASGDRVNAKIAFETAARINPKDISARLAVADLDYAAGNREEAAASLRQLVVERPENVAARVALGIAEEGLNHGAEAVRHYRKALERESGNLVALNNLAFLLLDDETAGDEALALAQKAKQLYPDNDNVDDTLGWVNFRRGLYPTAVKHLELAVSKRPTARRKYHLAMAYFKAGTRERARQTLAEGLQIDPKLPEGRVATQLMGMGIGSN